MTILILLKLCTLFAGIVLQTMSWWSESLKSLDLVSPKSMWAFNIDQHNSNPDCLSWIMQRTHGQCSRSLLLVLYWSLGAPRRRNASWVDRLQTNCSTFQWSRSWCWRSSGWRHKCHQHCCCFCPTLKLRSSKIQNITRLISNTMWGRHLTSTLGLMFSGFSLRCKICFQGSFCWCWFWD